MRLTVNEGKANNLRQRQKMRDVTTVNCIIRVEEGFKYYETAVNKNKNEFR